MSMEYAERLEKATDSASKALKEGVQFISAVADASREWDVEFSEVQAKLTERSAIRRASVARYKEQERNNIRLYERPKRIDVDGDVLPAIDVKSQPVYILAASLDFPYLRYDCPYEDGDDEELLITVIPGTERVWKNAIMRIYRQGHPSELGVVISALASMRREAQRKEGAK